MNNLALISEQRDFVVSSSSLKDVRNFSREVFEKVNIDQDLKDELVLAIAEAAQNIVKHAYNGQPTGDTMRVELSFKESIVYGFNETRWAMTLMTSSLKMIFQGNVSRDEVGSVIMIGDMAGQAAQAGLVPFLFLMALISVNLAYINILPIPGLDGGHIALILIEVLMGRKLSVKARIRIQSVGMFILLSLMVFLLLNDIIRVFF